MRWNNSSSKPSRDETPEELIFPFCYFVCLLFFLLELKVNICSKSQGKLTAMANKNQLKIPQILHFDLSLWLLPGQFLIWIWVRSLILKVKQSTSKLWDEQGKMKCGFWFDVVG